MFVKSMFVVCRVPETNGETVGQGADREKEFAQNKNYFLTLRCPEKKWATPGGSELPVGVSIQAKATVTLRSFLRFRVSASPPPFRVGAGGSSPDQV